MINSRFEIVFFALQIYSQRLGLCRTVKMVAHGAPRRVAQIWRFRAWSIQHENDAPRAARGRAPCASVLEPHNKPKCSEYLCNEKDTMRASTCSKLWSSSMTFYAQIQAISRHLSRAHAAAGPRAFSDACRWAARLHGTRTRAFEHA